MSNRLAFIFLTVHSKTVTAKEVFPQPTACVILEQPLGHVKVREETVVKVDCSSAEKGELRALLITPKVEMPNH